jgi:hypothetical protein
MTDFFLMSTKEKVYFIAFLISGILAFFSIAYLIRYIGTLWPKKVGYGAPYRINENMKYGDLNFDKAQESNYSYVKGDVYNRA